MEYHLSWLGWIETWRIAGVIALLFVAGCHEDECGGDKGESACDGQKLMYCQEGHAIVSAHWETLIDCETMGARCEETVYPPGAELDLSGESAGPVDAHGCIISDKIPCEAEPRARCSSDGQLIGICTSSTFPDAILTKINHDNAPYCVEASNGNAGFSIVDEDCVQGESICVDTDSTNDMHCLNGFFSKPSVGCSRFQRCVDTIDSDNLRHVQCVNNSPCSEETGSYDVCEEEAWYYHCFVSEIGRWRWEEIYCSKGYKCHQVAGDTFATCISD